MSKDGPPSSGSLVALEGLSEDALETQLRLLPASSQILVLPSLQQYLGTQDGLLPTSAASSAAAAAAAKRSASFDARRFIRRVHEAAAARTAIALEFLQDDSSTKTQATRRPKTKIVFLNGGTATSHALCIEAIRQHDTAAGGNLEQAALLFDQLIAHGVSGLDGDGPAQGGQRKGQRPAPPPAPPQDGTRFDEDDSDDDPITKAMRAADALDRKTEALQPSTHILDLTIKPRPRSLSLPIHGDLLDLLDAGRRLSQISASGDDHASSSIWVRPSVAAGAAGSEVYDVNFISSPSRASPTSTIFPLSMRLDAIAAQQPPSLQLPLQPTSPRQFVSYTSATTGETMHTVVLGPAPRGRSRRRSSRDRSQPHRRARSLERTLSSGSNSSGLGMNFFFSSSSREPSSTRPRRPSNVSDSSSTAFAALGTVPDVPLLPAADALEKMARNKKAAPSRTGLQQKPQLRLKTPGPVVVGGPSRRPMYIDRGTDAESVTSAGASATLDTFEPVLPLVEDLTIRFDDGTTNLALELAIQRFKEGDGTQIAQQEMQPQHHHQQEDQYDQKTMSSALPETPKSSHDHSSSGASAAAGTTSSSVGAANAVSDFSADDYDPFAPHEYNSGPKLPVPPSVRSRATESTIPMTQPSVKTPQPPTPAHTPPPPMLQALGSAVRPPRESIEGNDEDHRHHPRFYILATNGYRTVLALHNALRSVLGVYFPPSRRNGHDRTTSRVSTNLLFSYLPGIEGGSLWTPLFGDIGVKAETGAETTETAGAGHRIDMVLAVGGQRGVQPDFVAKVTGQLDALGVQPATGISRSGRLDIRYLIANAMPALAAQQVRSHIAGSGDLLAAAASSGNAAHVLATLVLAQLELYLRTYPSVRFVLLDYPLELLAVVLALQQLVGRDAVQVASIVAADDKYGEGRPGFQTLHASPKAALPRSLSSSFAPSSADPLMLDPDHPPFSRANFLLTSAANDADVAAFVSSVRKRLVSSPSAAAYYGPASSQSPTLPPMGMAALATAQQDSMGRYSALSTATTAAGGASSRTPPRISNVMQSPTLPGLESLSPRRRGSSEKRVAVASSTPPPPLSATTAKKTTPKAARPPKSPAPSTKSQQSQASSLQSQADSWRTTAKTPSYTTTSMPTTSLAPAPIVLPSGRLVAKAIQVKVSGPAPRRVKEEAAVVVNPLPNASSIADSDNLSNWDAGLDVSEDGNYAYDDVPAYSHGNSNGNDNGNVAVDNVYDDGDDDDGDDYDDYDDDFDNDVDMRRLMPLFLRDRAALLAAKEAAGARGVRPPAARSKSSRLTGSMMTASTTNTISSSHTAAPSPSATRSRTMHDMRDYQQTYHPPPATAAATATGLRSKASLGSVHSEHSHGSHHKNNNDGKKALRWLGLA